jgi:excisionase family DNA binding protein
VGEAAAVLNCSASFVYKLMGSGEIAYERRGRRKLPVRESVEEYRQRNRVDAAPRPTPSGSRERPQYQFKHLFQGKSGARRDKPEGTPS